MPGAVFYENVSPDSMLLFFNLLLNEACQESILTKIKCPDELDMIVMGMFPTWSSHKLQPISEFI